MLRQEKEYKFQKRLRFLKQLRLYQKYPPKRFYIAALHQFQNDASWAIATLFGESGTS